MLIVVFGLTGSGKNFVSNIIAKRFNFYFYDADRLLTQIVLRAIKNQEIFTQKMRDEITQLLISKITELKKNYFNIVLAQGLYKNSNRMQVLAAHSDAQFLYVEAKLENRMIRLKKRNNDADINYAKKTDANFEKPIHPYNLIENDSDETAVLQQIISLFSNKKSK